ncbi:MAG: hypothetical protein U9P44_00165 [archaeon]|nr:hypothetical protein [archaeon]
MIFKKDDKMLEKMMLANDKINRIEVEVADLKSFVSRLDNDITEAVKPLKNEIKEIREHVKAVQDKLGVFDSAIHENLEAESSEISKMKLFNSSISGFRNELDGVLSELESVKSELARFGKKEITVQQDSGLDVLRKDFDEFKKKALTIDDRI